MIYVTLITKEHFFHKLDCKYAVAKFADLVVAKFADLVDKAVIVFICTNEDWRKEETWKRKGKTFHTIRLPYQQQVKEMEDTCPLLLETAAKRLGIPVPDMEDAVAA